MFLTFQFHVYMYICNIKCCTYICETCLQCEALCKCNHRRALYKSDPFVFNAWSGRTNRTKVSLPSDQYLKRCSLKGRKETSQIQSLLNEQHCDQEKCLERPSGWVTVAHTTWAAEAPLSLVGYYTFAAWHSSAFFSTFAGCLIFEIIMVKKHISVVDTEKSRREKTGEVKVRQNDLHSNPWSEEIIDSTNGMMIFDQ